MVRTPCAFSVLTVGDHMWRLQMYQTGMHMEKGRTYDLTLWAKSDGTGNITANCMQNHEPWDHHTQAKFIVSTEWETSGVPVCRRPGMMTMCVSRSPILVPLPVRSVGLPTAHWRRPPEQKRPQRPHRRQQGRRMSKRTRSTFTRTPRSPPPALSWASRVWPGHTSAFTPIAR